VTDHGKFPTRYKNNSRTRAAENNRSFVPEQLNAGFCRKTCQKIGSARPFWGRLDGFQQFDKASP
jgi:hypothetical protein